MQHLIQELTILLLVSLPINLFFHRIKLPSVMGFLIAGILIGPNGLQFISDSDTIEHLAEIGVILLLFVIGLEFSLRHMMKNISVVLGVGLLQIGFVGVVIFFVFQMLNLPSNQAFVVGMLVALSSTAIVMKMITDRAEINTDHGRICIGVLLFQDLCVVPMMLVIPLLSQSGEISMGGIGWALLKSGAAVVGIFLLSRLWVPRSLEWIARLGSREHLTLFVILIVLGTGWMSQELGLTLAMGAFIAGMIISESEYSHQIILDILPLKDYFGSIFFISVGMLLNVPNFFESSFFYIGLTLAVIGGKGLLTFLAGLIMKNSFRVSMVVGIRLAQVGEFSLILATLALNQELFSTGEYQSFLIVSILSMLLAPVLIQFSSRFAMELHSQIGQEGEDEGQGSKLSGHVIISSYGIVGRNLARVLKETNTPFLVVDLDGERIKQALNEDMMAEYGDATHRDTLLRVGIERARMIVFSLRDPFELEQGVRLSRRLNPNIFIIVRTQLSSQVDGLKQAGANQVIPEEFETSIEIFSRVLREYHIPNNIIEQQIELIRLEGYSMFRGLSLNAESLQKFSTYLAASLTESFLVMDDSWANQKSVQELGLNEDGAKLIAVVRRNEIMTNILPEFRFQSSDTLVLFGRHAHLDQCVRYLQLGGNMSDSKVPNK